MTSVHPISNDTIVEINQNRIHSSKAKQKKLSFNDELNNDDQIKNVTQAQKNVTFTLNQENKAKDENIEIENINHESFSENKSLNTLDSQDTSSLASSINFDQNSYKETNFSQLNVNNLNDLEVDQNIVFHQPFSLIWKNLSFFVEYREKFGLKKKKKLIFNKINGQLESNKLIALMGPSGAGKSSLLNCLSFKNKKNVSGEIKIKGNLKNFKISFIPQEDLYFKELTCFETLIFASKLKNSSCIKEDTLLELKSDLNNNQDVNQFINKNFHEAVVMNVLSLLGLTEQKNVLAGKLSGGQKKRLSIAQELVTRPHIIFLDEPTSGLDSFSSFQCINLLYKITQQSTPISVVATIHQPNPKTFQLFDKVYVLACNGKIIFNDSPLQVVPFLNQQNIDVPVYYSPADYIIELASNESEKLLIDKLSDNIINQQTDNVLNEGIQDARSFSKIPSYKSFFYEFKTLFNRCFLLTIRNPMLTTNRILSHLFMALFIGWVYGPNVGKGSDCPVKLGLVLDKNELQKLTNHTVENIKQTTDNMSSIFFGIIVIIFGSLLPTLVTYPYEITILQKEIFNGWYKVKPYFYARLFADLPLQIISPLIYISVTYILNGQPIEDFRILGFFSCFILTSVVSQCHGIIISTYFSHDLTSAVYLGPISAMPLLLFSGFLVRVQRMPALIRPLTFLSYMRFSFEGIVVSIYGFNRCGDEAIEQNHRIRKQIGQYFQNLMSLVQAGLDCDDDDLDKKSNLKETTFLIFNESNRLEYHENEKLLLDSSNQTTENSIFSSLLDYVLSSELDDKGKIMPRVMQLFDLNDNYLSRSIIALIIYVLLTRILSYYLIKWKVQSK